MPSAGPDPHPRRGTSHPAPDAASGAPRSALAIPPGAAEEGPDPADPDEAEPDRAERADRGGRRERRPPTGSPYNAALNLLAQRDHSRAELARKLTRRQFEPDAVEAALDKLERTGLIDDDAFATNFAASRAARGAAAVVIRRDLAAKGVGTDRAARAAADASPPEVEAARCKELATTWLRRRGELPPEVAARRLAGYLARRGYAAGLVATTVTSLTGDALGEGVE